MPITTEDVSLNTAKARCTRYNIMWQSLYLGTLFSSANKTNRHDITKISLYINKGNNKITELRTILQRESQNS